MKKILFNSFIALSFFSSIIQTKAQCSFDIVGTTSVSPTSPLSDMAVAPNNKVYTIAYNTTPSNIQLKSAFTASSSWTLNATITTTTSVKPVIKIRNDGKIYVFINDGIANVGKVYSSTGGTLTQVGAAVSTGSVSDLSIAFNSIGEEFVAYADGANSNRTTVKKLSGGIWVNVGTTGIASTSGGYYNSLILDNTDNPVVAFRDFFNGYKISVMKLSGSNWVSVTGTGVVSTNQGTNSVLKVARNGNYYLGYTETPGDEAIVQIYNGSVWTPLGSPVAGLLSTANSFDFDLDPTDVPYFTAILNTAYYPTAYKYVGVPTWTTVATGYINSSTNNTNPTIDIDNTGTPYFSYVDVFANNDLNVKILASPISISTQPLATQLICDGSAGSFSVSVAGGTPTYQWQTATTGVFANAGAPYTNASTNILSFTANPGINQNKVRCIINVGCKNIISNTSTLTVLNNPTVNLTTTNPSCFGVCNGMITANPIGGTAPYTFSWSPTVGSSATLPSLCAGTYSVLVKDANNCSVSANANLFSPSGISSSVSGNLTICSGNSTTLTLTAAGGTPGYTFSWSPGATLSSTNTAVVVATPTITTTYTANVTDANGCIKSTSVTVTVNALPAVSAGPDNSICLGGSAVNSATGAHTYTWNPGNFVGANQNVTPFSTTTYTVVGTNTLTGCTNSDFKIVTVNPNPTVNAISSPTSICAGSTSTLTASGAVSYTWNPSGLTGPTITVSPASTTVYTLTGMAATGCSNTKTLSLTVNPNPTITAVSSPTTICAGSSATLTGSGASTYTWMPGALTGTSVVLTPTTTTNYTVTGRSAAGCLNTSSVLLTVNPNPVATASNSGSLTCTTVTVALNSGAVAGGTYLWSGPGITGPTTTQNTTANMAGNYTVLVTNSGTGCSSSAITSVIQNTTAPITNTTVSGVLNCTLTSVNASATTTTSPVTYNWTGSGIVSGATTGTITVNAGGIKNYTVTNASNGCATTGSLNVSQNLLNTTPTASAIGTITCLTSTVQLNGTPGSGVTYTWTGSGFSGGVNSQNAIATSTGIYTLSTTFISSACTNAATVAVMQNTVPPTVSATTSGTLTCTTTTVMLNGGPSTGVSYLWTGGATTQNTSANTPGVYSLLVTNSVNGCTNIAVTNVTQNTTVPTINAGSNQTITCSSPTVAFNAVSSADPMATYSWTAPGGGSLNNNTINNPTASGSGVFTVSVTDSGNGCISTATVEIFADASIPFITLSASSSTICSGNSTTLTASGSAGIDYTWNPGSLNGAVQNVSPVTTTVFTVVATNTINGCASTETTSVIVNPNPILAITGNTNICKGSTTNLNASGAMSYLWNTGAITASISETPTVTTTYTVNGTDINGCSNSSTTMVSIISSKSITGVITNTNGATGGDVILYKYTSALSQWDSVTITPIGASYSFTNIDSALYVVRAVPTATNIQVTYGTSSISWQNATVITHGCSNNTNQDITLIPLESFTAGPGVLTGTITEASGFGHRISSGLKPLAPGGPIGGIVVKGGRNPGGQMFVQTTTNAAGQYTLTGLPIGNDYFVFVDIPGLDTNGTYHVVITSGVTQIDGLNFTVDSIYINPIGSVTGISQENSILNNKILMFPNPAKQYVSIQYELIQSANVQIELYDIIGKKVKTITEVNRQEKNKYNHIVNLENLSSGIYFVKLKINNSENVIKLIVND